MYFSFYEFYNRNNKEVRLKIDTGSKWSQQKDTNDYMNTIFEYVDNGDDIIQDSELSVLNKILAIAAKKASDSGCRFQLLSNDALKEVADELESGAITIKGDSVIQEKYLQNNIAVSGSLQITPVKDTLAYWQDKNRTEKEIKKIEEQLSAKYPKDKYHIEVYYDGRYYKYEVYDLNKPKQEFENNIISKFLDGNTDVLNDIEDPIIFLSEYRKQSGGNTVYSYLLEQFQNGQISKDKFIEAVKILERKFYEYENTYEDSFKTFKSANPASKNTSLYDGNSNFRYCGNDYG